MKKNSGTMAATIQNLHANFNTSNKPRPAFSRNYSPEKSRYGECSWLFIADWRAASSLSRIGKRNILCIPPAHDPTRFDWSILRGESVVVWTYCPIDAKELAITLRAAGALDISIIEARTGKILALALTKESARLLDDIRKEALPC